MWIFVIIKNICNSKGKIQVERNREMKEKIHALTEEMLENMGKLVAIDSQLGTPEEGKPFGEGPDRKSVV